MSNLNGVYATALGGMSAAAAQMTATAGKLASLTRTDGAGNPTLVEVVGPLTDLVREQVMYTANAAVVRAADHMTGTLLDMMDEHNDRARGV